MATASLSLEAIELELKRKLEEIERKKQLLKALEEEEKRLLDEIAKLGGYQTGSIQVKWVYCGKCKKCPHGPYYYLVKKEGGKVKWKYIGKVVDSKDYERLMRVKEISRRLREIQRQKRALMKV